MTHNTFMAIGLAREMGVTVSTDGAQKLFEFIRAAYNRGLADALPMHADLVAEAVAAEREACALACDDIESDLWALYKGRLPYTGREPERADPHAEGRSDGAGECAAAIRARGANV